MKHSEYSRPKNFWYQSAETRVGFCVPTYVLDKAWVHTHRYSLYTNNLLNENGWMCSNKQQFFGIKHVAVSVNEFEIFSAFIYHACVLGRDKDLHLVTIKFSFI